MSEANYKRILLALKNAGAACYEVGGCVRDLLLGLTPKDFDIEVYNLDISRLVSILAEFGVVSTCGKSFGVSKLRTCEAEYDFSLPRRENKIGVGHKGFVIEADSSLTPAEAALRRDFTINSMSQDPLTGEIYDAYGGRMDLTRGILRATSKAFSEDPLRVLRGFQFAARFDMSVERHTANMCRSLRDEYSSLPKERIFQEWVKWAEKGVNLYKGLKFLEDVGWLSLFPELFDLVECPQDPEWHPEKCVWNHTLHVVDAIGELIPVGHPDRLVMVLAALCHDMGKPSTTIFKQGRIRSPGHDVAGEPIARRFLESIGCFPDMIEKVCVLTREHMAHVYGDPSLKSVRKLSVRLSPANIEELLVLIEADHNGRPPLPKGLPRKAQVIKELATHIGIANAPLKPLVQGRHLIELGLAPGPEFGKIIKRCFELQLEGILTDVRQANSVVSEMKVSQ